MFFTETFFGWTWKFLNPDEFPDILKNLGEDFKNIGSWDRVGVMEYKYYRFKALKPSINEIVVKFQESIKEKNKNKDLVIKINILKKAQTS